MNFIQSSEMSSLIGKLLKLGQFTNLGSYISSTESGVNISLDCYQQVIDHMNSLINKKENYKQKPYQYFCIVAPLGF